MPDSDWGGAVMICHKNGECIHVNSAGEALTAMLLNAWPTISGRHFFAALQICSGVEEGLFTPAQARLEFIAAAREAPVEFLQFSTL